MYVLERKNFFGNVEYYVNSYGVYVSNDPDISKASAFTLDGALILSRKLEELDCHYRVLRVDI